MTAPRSATCNVTWWGHSAATVEMDGVRVVTDPLLRRRVGPLRNHGWWPSGADLAAVDLVLLTHLHRDHADLPSLARLADRTRVVVPRGAGALVARHVRGPVEELDVGETWELGPLRVRAVPAMHDGRRGLGGPVAQAVGYVVSGSGSVYLAGDTDLFPQMAAIPDAAPAGELALALVPVGGWGLTLGPGHLDPARAARAIALLRPRIAVPVHWQTLRPPLAWRLRPDRFRTPGQDFVTAAAGVAPDTRTVVLRPGEQLEVPSTKGA